MNPEAMMRKHKHAKQVKAPQENGEQLGCVWSIFLQALKYRNSPWHNVRKRLPHKRQGPYRHTKGELISITLSIVNILWFLLFVSDNLSN